MTINQVAVIDDNVKVNNVLISVSDKGGLDVLVPGLLAINPGIRFFSTGGTFTHLEKILGADAKNCLIQVSDYTGQPETQGGLVKTLDFKVYLSLLTETYNPFHQSDLRRTRAVPIDMVVCNLYPFSATIAKVGCTPEMARGNIDIGGPCMIRAAAKNHIRVCSVIDPGDYQLILDSMKNFFGCIPFDLRYYLTRKAFTHTAEYDRKIADYFEATAADTARACYQN